jgi:hypothetical protein
MKLINGILYSGNWSSELDNLVMFVAYLKWEEAKRERQHIS